MDFTKEQWNQEKRRQIENDVQTGFKKTDSGGYKSGQCPECGEPSLWINSGLTDIKCNHKNSCGFQTKVKKFYPDLYQALCDRYSPDPESPKGKAKGYLARRGLDVNDTWYTQESGYCKSDKQYYPTVRFHLDQHKNVYWERFIDCNQKHKANFKGSYKGLAWIPPGLDLEEQKRIWLVEGIFDAVSLLSYDIATIAVLSSNNTPDQVINKYKGKNITWVIGFDNDPLNPKSGTKAGLEATKKLAAYLESLGENYEVAFPPYKQDWNDLHLARALNEEMLEKCFWRGRLNMAESPEKYGYILSERYRGSFVYEFADRLYGWKPYTADDEDDPENDFNSLASKLNITKISNFGLDFLYCLENETIGKTSYYCRISFPTGQPSRQIELDSSEIGERSPFRKALFKTAPGAIFKGDQFWVDAITDQWFKKELSIVKSLPWTGYDPVTKAFVLQEVAYDDQGRYYLPNSYGYFDLPNGNKIKPSSDIPTMFSDQLNISWFDDFLTCYGFNGLVSLAFWTASIFAEQFRDAKKSFPFLAVVGPPGTGKSTMLEFFWRLYGRTDSWEGVPLSDASTKVGFYRLMEQLSNMPTVFIEDDETKQGKTKFNFEHFKASFNGRVMRVTGKATQGNETNLPKFRSSIVIGQNAKVEGSSALRERIIELFFDKSHFTNKSLEAAERFETYTTADVCGYRHYLLSNQKDLLPRLISEYETGLKTLRRLANDDKNGPLKNNRVVHTHAVIYGGARLLQDVFKRFGRILWEKFEAKLLQLAIERQLAVREDTPLVQLFFETVEWFKENGNDLNHSMNPNFIAINLNELISACDKEGLRHFSDIQQLRRELKNSTFYKFLASNKTTKSATKPGKQRKCWVFKIPD